MASKLLVMGNKVRADRINTLWDSAVADMIGGFVAVGAALEEAHQQLSTVDYNDMVQHRLRFGARTAERLRAVSKDRRLATHASLLPPHWTTLYEITKLDDTELDQALKDGTIHPDMERKDVPKKRKESPAGTPGIAVSDGSFSDFPPVADAAPVTADDREGGDSVVTELQEPEPPATEGPAQEAEGKPPPQTVGFVPPRDGLIPFWVERDGGDALTFSAELAMAIHSSKALTPESAVESYGEHIPLMTGDVTAFIDWLGRFEAAFRERYGIGNDAALQAAD